LFIKLLQIMDNKQQLINILKAEVIFQAQELLRDINRKDIKELYKSTRKLYEKLATIQQLSEHLDTNELLNLVKNETIPEKEIIKKEEFQVENSIIEEKIEEKIIEEPSEKKREEIVKPKTENAYKKVSDMKFVPKDFQPKKAVSTKKMNIGLNDKISFINHLFDKNADAFNIFIEKLNAFDDFEEALKYIYKDVKSQYNNWEGKDEYEFRLIQLLELKFN